LGMVRGITPQFLSVLHVERIIPILRVMQGRGLQTVGR
jgi:hypothetical protein